MTCNFNVTGTQRKELVNAIAGILECDVKYLGMPSMAYQVNYFTIGKNGEVAFDNRADSEEIENLFARLEERGFTATPVQEDMGLTIILPADKVNVDNLSKMLEAKGTLIKKALGVEDLPIEVEEERVLFPWFTIRPDEDKIPAYTHFVTALCEMSMKLQRVVATERDVDSEKYALRCFLIRLGLVGDEYKATRKILLKNLTGSCAFRNQEEADKHKAKYLEKRKAAKELAAEDGGEDDAVSA